VQLDLETIRWLLSGFFIAGGALISWLIKRETNQLKGTLDHHDTRIVAAHQLIATAQLDLAKNYVSKIELEKTLDAHIAPLRSDMRDIKDDIKSLLQRP
jgi:hypothetical protein